MSALVSSDIDWCDGDDGLIAFKETLLGGDVNDLTVVVPRHPCKGVADTAN